MITYVLEQIENVTDQQFMESVYKKHKYIMFATAKKYASDNSVCEDLIQDSLIKLIPKMDTLRSLDRCKLAAYVVSTVRNTARNYLRELSTERKYLFFEDISEDMYCYCSDERQMEELFISSEMSAELRQVITELSEKEQELILRKYFLYQTDSEIAACLKCSPNSIRMMLTRARRHALERLNEKGYHYEVK